MPDYTINFYLALQGSFFEAYQAGSNSDSSTAQYDPTAGNNSCHYPSGQKEGKKHSISHKNMGDISSLRSWHSHKETHLTAKSVQHTAF